MSGRIAELEVEIKLVDYKRNESMAAVLASDIVSLEEQLKTAEQDRQSAENAGDSLGVLQAEFTISNCTREIQEKKESLTACQLQLDLDAYYAENGDRLSAAREMQDRYERFSYEMGIKNQQARMTYLLARQKELEKKLEINRRKQELGYATELDVSVVQCETDENSLMMQEVQEEIDCLTELLALYGEGGMGEAPPDHLPELSKDYVLQFCNDSTEILYYEQQIKAYGNYMDHMDETDENLEKTRLQAELAGLNKQRYQTELEKYVRQKEKTYRQNLLKVQEFDLEIAVADQRLQNGRLLLEKGRFREVDAMELETEKARLQYERNCCVCEAWLAYYLLENSIVD